MYLSVKAEVERVGNEDATSVANIKYFGLPRSGRFFRCRLTNLLVRCDFFFFLTYKTSNDVVFSS